MSVMADSVARCIRDETGSIEKGEAHSAVEQERIQNLPDATP